MDYRLNEKNENPISKDILQETKEGIPRGKQIRE